jgi:hypothetical protein
VKRQVFGLAVLLVVLGAVLANAQSSTLMVSNIPFDFIVGDVALPGGEYSILASDLNGKLLLRNRKGYTLFISVMPAEKVVGEAENKLVFHQVNGQYFLASIWTADNPIGRALSPSHHERIMLAQGGQPVLRELRAGTR